MHYNKMIVCPVTNNNPAEPGGSRVPPRRSPIEPRKLVEMGNRCVQQGDFRGALVAYDLAQAVLPNDAEVARMRALTLLRLERVEEGLASIERSLDLNPEHPAAYTIHGAALVELGRCRDALKALDLALELNPAAPDAMYNKACAHSLLGEGDQALLWLKQAVQAYPDYRSIARDDPNLDILRLEPGFKPTYTEILGD